MKVGLLGKVRRCEGVANFVHLYITNASRAAQLNTKHATQSLANRSVKQIESCDSHNMTILMDIILHSTYNDKNHLTAIMRVLSSFLHSRNYILHL